MKKRVVVALIQDLHEGEKRCFLIASKKEFGTWTGHFYPPGGHVEVGETDEQALRRELLEELGVVLKNSSLIIETPGDVPEQITAWYRCEVEGTWQLNEKELAKAGFFSVSQIEKLPLWPATKTFLEQYFLRE